jgi:diguanylate cyclase (GGDEF)-like protein
MISLKMYMDGAAPVAAAADRLEAQDALTAVLAAYGAAMRAIGSCSVEACPSLGDDLTQRLGELSLRLSIDLSPEAIGEVDRAIQEQLQTWAHRASRYHRDKAIEVKELLLSIVRTAESVSRRDRRCADQMSQVTARLRQIATLEDVTQIRASVEKGAAELRNSIERMAAEGKAAIDELRKEVKEYQTRLEDAEELASRDALTGARNRTCVESLMEERIAIGAEFCVAMIDINGFKKVNDKHGHLVGDEVLKLFAGELRSACRATDVIGRWGGDEFIMLLDCRYAEADAQIKRLTRWVCGDYAVKTGKFMLKLPVGAAVGLAEHRSAEPLNGLIARADAAMYEDKAAMYAARGHALPQARQSARPQIAAGH